MSKPSLEMKDVEFAYAGRGFSIKGFSLEIKEGQSVALIGPNGAGKSTVLKLAAGILKPANGSVLLSGREVASYAPQERASVVSYLPQIVDTSIPFRVGELVGMGLYARRNKTGKTGKSEVEVGFSPDEAMRITGLFQMRGEYITRLSGGERRRVYAAMLLVQGARLALLDEPLQNLDLKYQAKLIELFKDLNTEKKVTTIMALHDIGAAFHFDVVCVMKAGELCDVGEPRRIITPELIKEVFEVSAANGWCGGPFFKVKT